MKNKFLFLSLLMSVSSFAQDEIGSFSLDNRSGVLNVVSNPASISTNPQKWSVGVSTNLYLINNAININYKTIKDFKNKNSYIEDFSGAINIDVLAPSVMYKINEKHTVGASFRTRALANFSSINMRFLSPIINNDLNNFSIPIKIDEKKHQTFSVNQWYEYGLTWAGKIFTKDKHSITAGATLKYLSGNFNAYFNIDHIKGTIDEDKNTSRENPYYLTDASGTITFRNLENLNLVNKNLTDINKIPGNGVGADIGFIYEYQGEEIEQDNDEKTQETNYKLKVGVSLLDLGGLTYKSNPKKSFDYSLHVDANTKIYADELKTLENSNYGEKRILSSDYYVSLPTSMRIMVDYNINNKFFLAFNSRFSVVNDAPQNPYYNTDVTLIPRYDYKWFGAYLPLNYNGMSGVNVGTGLRLGPVILGSSNIISLAASGKAKHAGAFIGIRFGN